MEILEFKGTKGEWKRVKLKATEFYTERNEIHYGNYGECVAEFVSNDNDAKLISAAPELLYALQFILESKNNMKHYMSFDSSLMEAIDLGEKAIEKALK